MGLDIYLNWNGQTEAEKEAQFTGFRSAGEAGYLRSAYNDAGFNSWCRQQLNVDGFHFLFDYDDEREQVVGHYEDGEKKHGFFPDWDAARERTNDLIEKVKALPPLVLVRVGAGLQKPSLDEAEILSKYAEVTGQDRPLDGWFSNAAGLFMPTDPPTVKAAMWAKGFFGTDLYLVCEAKESPHGYYLGVLESVLKFIDLGQQKSGWLVWSG